MPLGPKIQKVHENLNFVPISEFSQNVFWFLKNLPHAIFDIMFDPNICIFTITVRRAFPRSFFTTGPVLRNCRLSNVWSNLKKVLVNFFKCPNICSFTITVRRFFSMHFFTIGPVWKKCQVYQMCKILKSLVYFFISRFMVVFSNKNIIEALVIINCLIKFFKHLVLVILVILG